MKGGKVSLIYRHILIYRLVMNLLYKLKYKQRFLDVFEQIEEGDQAVLELCFGDIYIAGFCRDSGRSWRGLDLNPGFIRMARKKGFLAEEADLLVLPQLPSSDVCIMAGSLYHFMENLEDIFAKMLAAAPKIILSEPISNFSSSNSWLGRIARRAADAGRGEESRRFSKESLLEALGRMKKRFSFRYQVIKESRDLLVVIQNG